MDSLVQLCKKMRDYIIAGLKSTSHDAALCEITFKSELRQAAAVIAFSTIKRPVSSAKSLMSAQMSFT